jgi:hypothetical protein
VQIGAENRTKLIAAVALMAVAIVLLGRWMFSSGGDSPAAANSPTNVAAPTTLAPTPKPRSRGKKVTNASRSLDPTLRYDWLRVSEDTKYEGRGRNIFRAQIDLPRPIKNGATDQAKAPPQPTGPPPPPPINLKFFGFASKPGEPKKIFLSQGEDVFIAGEGEIVDRRYRILRISPMAVEVEDVLNNNRQSIPLTQG